jgi:hypothetical protein
MNVPAGVGEVVQNGYLEVARKQHASGHDSKRGSRVWVWLACAWPDDRPAKEDLHRRKDAKAISPPSRRASGRFADEWTETESQKGLWPRDRFLPLIIIPPSAFALSLEMQRSRVYSVHSGARTSDKL